MNFFTKEDAPLNDQDKSLVSEIESLPPEYQQDAIAMLFGALVYDYNNASESGAK